LCFLTFLANLTTPNTTINREALNEVTNIDIRVEDEAFGVELRTKVSVM
jgi:hypothetical protein